jgi:hypothetical protein
MTYHMRDMKNLTRAPSESLAHALVACALCTTATVLLLAITLCLT